MAGNARRYVSGNLRVWHIVEQGEDWAGVYGGGGDAESNRANYWRDCETWSTFKYEHREGVYKPSKDAGRLS